MKFWRIFFLSWFLIGVLMAPTALATTIISPVVEVALDPGTTRQGAVKVYNETDQILKLTAIIDAVRGSNQFGEPLFGNEQPAYLSWIIVEQPVLTLGPGQAALVPFTVTAPRNATPGGYYAAIFWQEISPDNRRDVGVTGRVGTLVFLTVRGKISEQIDIRSFSPEPIKKIWWRVPVTLRAILANSGNIHLQPAGNITLTNRFGYRTVLAINDEQRAILPGSERQFDILWPGVSLTGQWWRDWWSQTAAEVNNFTFGRYHAVLTLTYGVNQPRELRAETDFFVVPIHLIITFVVGLLVSLMLLRVNRRVKRLSTTAKRSTPPDNSSPPDSV